MTQIISRSKDLVNCVEMSLTILVIDESLGDPRFVKQLLEEVENVTTALITDDPKAFSWDEFVPDVFVLGANWLDWAREIRKRFPRSAIIGRGPWQGSTTHEFFPWGDELRDPTLPITSLIPRYREPA